MSPARIPRESRIVVRLLGSWRIAAQFLFTGGSNDLALAGHERGEAVRHRSRQEVSA
jgi:hypothetical protein